MKIIFLLLVGLLPMNTFAQLELRPEVKIPELPNFRALPAEDAEFNAEIEKLVVETKLDEMTPADKSVDKEDEWSSICVVDLTDPDNPRVAGWKADNFLYPSSTYKFYVLGEAIRQVCEGERSLDDKVVVKEHNARSDSKPVSGGEYTLSEILRWMLTYSDNTAANVAIDVVDRQRASALLRAMGLQGSDITRKFVPRDREDEGYAKVPGTVTNSRHYATFLYAVETGAIGGGRGRGLIKAYMGHIEVAPKRMRAGLPDSATLYSKNGEWENFVGQVAIIEDGKTKYISCVMTPYRRDVAEPRIADFTKRLHELMSSK